jgi:hypothetical protein
MKPASTTDPRTQAADPFDADCASVPEGRRGSLSRALGIVIAALAAAGLLAAGCAPRGDGDVAPEAAGKPSSELAAPAIAVSTGLGFLKDRDVHQAQFAGGADGSLYVVWRQPADGRGSDLWLARRGEGGVFTPPVRINDLPGTVANVDLDESRAGVAVGPDGLIAVAWTARGSDIRAAISRDGGASFEPSLNLNSDEGAGAYRGFVDIDVDAAGIAHAAWIDGRFAPPRAEEPAELYYARIEDDLVTEINLTEQQADSICGCCRIDVDVRDDDTLVIAFRNTGGGYRDVFRVEAGTADRAFGEPARLGPPMWELRGCPVIGPLNVGDATLWSEASTGKRRILAAVDTGGDFEVIAEDGEAWSIERPPRRVVGAPPGEGLLLLPGRPGGKILRGAGSSWTVAAEDIPRWAMSAAVIGADLVLLGDLDGEAQAESRPLNF